MNFNIFGGYQKNEYFWGYGDFGLYFLDHRNIGLYLGVISMHFIVFSKGQSTEWWIFFGVAKSFNIFLGCLKFLIFFFWGGG